MIHICIPPIYLNSINVHRYIDKSYLFDFCPHLRSMIVLIDVCIDPWMDSQNELYVFLYLFIGCPTKSPLNSFQDSWFDTRFGRSQLHHATKMMDIAPWSLGVVVKLVVADASFGAPSWNIGFTCGTVWKWALKCTGNDDDDDDDEFQEKYYWGICWGPKIMRQPWSPLFAKGCPEHQWILSQKGIKLACGTCIFVFQPCNYSIHIHWTSSI